MKRVETFADLPDPANYRGYCGVYLDSANPRGIYLSLGNGWRLTHTDQTEQWKIEEQVWKYETPRTQPMKTSHAFARELLAGPNLPIFHVDPSCAGCDPKIDTSFSIPKVEINDPKGGMGDLCPFVTIAGNRDEKYEAVCESESNLRQALAEANSLCRSLYAVALRDGRNTHWATLVDILAAALLAQHKTLFPDQYRKLEEEISRSAA